MTHSTVVASQEILQALGIKAMRTLTRWHRRGLIPAPDVRTHPAGRGKMAYWPKWVMHRCARIQALLRSGRTLDDVASLLVSLEDEERQSRRRYDFAAASKVLDEQARTHAFRDLVWNDVNNLIHLGRTWADTQLMGEVLRRAAERAVHLFQEGCNPCLVFDGVTTHVVPDFLVSARLEDSSRGTLLVVPLAGYVKECLSENLEPQSCRARPIHRAQIEDEDGVHEREFIRTGESEFQFVKKPRRHKTRRK